MSDTPERFADVDARPVPTAAAGPVAAINALRFAGREMGVLRASATLLKVNQAGGVDCPGCAWPEPKERSTFEFCENGAKHIAAEATRSRAGPDLFRAHTVRDLAARSDEWLEAQGRLTHPMVLRRGAERYEPIGWDEALDLCAARVKALASPGEAVFYTSGRTSNEAAFLWQLFARQLGTNNLPDCSNLCHESSGRGLSEVLGVGKGTVTLEDFAHADAIFVIGQNPGTNHPRMLIVLEEAARRGCRIVSINPLREPGLVRFKHPRTVRGMVGRGTALAERFLQVRINGDVALLKGLIRAALEEEVRRPGQILNREFIDAHTSGFQEFSETVLGVPWSDIEAGSGVSRADITAAAEIYWRAERVIACWAMGLTQHKNAVGNVQELVNLMLLRGNVGRPGAGLCPVRGHSNVQGDRTMGVTSRPSSAFLARLGQAFGFTPPAAHGLDVVPAIQAMHAGRVGVFIALGGNFVAATPDTAFTSEAVSRCGLTVQISTKLNRSHVMPGAEALILPCLGRTELDIRGGKPQLVSVENSMGIVHTSQGHLAPASEHARSEPAIVCGLARATLGDRPEWAGLDTDYDRIRDRIADVVPGFEDMNRRLRVPGGFVLPNAARDRTFNTASGRSVFTVHELPRHELAPGQLLMMTIRSHDQYNTTVYTQDDRYRGIHGTRRVVLMSESDLQDRGLREGQRVDLVSHFQGEERVAVGFAVMPYDIPVGCAATYFPEANVLVPVGSFADVSLTPASKSVVISIRQ